MDIMQTIRKMNIDEKISLLAGKDFWRTQDFEQYGIPSIEVSDGPCGVRKQMEACDHLGFNESLPATAYASGPSLASCWNKELVYQVGEALGRECNSYGVDMLLGPAINIQRSPLCGRHFEYFSEDPYYTGDLATHFINGVQDQGVGACIKHFAANNQETEREYIDTIAEERTLREIYLKAFEGPIKNARPMAVMTALNKINGEYCSESPHLLQDILREEWGYEGFVMSDWWGVNDRAKSVKAGLDLEMPYSSGVGQEKIKKALLNHELEEADIDKACERIIRAALALRDKKKEKVQYDKEAHHAIAKKMAVESIVLLKNQGGILPIDSDKKIAVIGAFAAEPKFKLAGSALVNPTMVDIPLDEIRKHATKEVVYAKGYERDSILQDQDLIREAVAVARQSEVAVLFVGLTDGIESEGHDRKNLHLPANHIELIESVAAVQKNIVVVLANGGPVDMPWQSNVKGIFESFLAGQAMGSAIADLLFGKENPSGKLPVTFAKELCQTPAYFNFPGDKVKVEYKEGIFVGYRYYDKTKIEPLYPFGYGLSYTSFGYSDLVLDKEILSDGECLAVQVKIKNSGKKAGKEVVQLYVGEFDSSVQKPVKELKGYEKIHLEPGEEKTVEFALNWQDFAYYNVDIQDWYVDEGNYCIMVGSSSKDIKAAHKIHIKSQNALPKKITGWSKVGRFRETKAGMKALKEMKQLARTEYCEEDLRTLLLDENKQNELDKTDIRFLTLKTQTVINNDLMEGYLRECNQEYVTTWKEQKKTRDSFGIGGDHPREDEE